MQKLKIKNCVITRKIWQFRLFFLILFISFFSIFSRPCLASIDVYLNVEGCNNNNICEPPVENNISCSNDCTSCNHNNVCELLKGETSLSCPSDCQVAPSGTGVSSVPIMVSGEILNLNIKTGINYAIISWDTAVPTYGSVSWGKGDSYNDGIINGIKITINHKIVIENLSASTTYSYFINSSLPESYYARNTGTFTTLPIPEIKIVPSIYNLTATSAGNEIVLNWNNPNSKDFYGVKIVRSPFFFPADSSEGKIIYDGTGTYTRDSDITPDTKYYYSAFSYNKDLNFSSGVVVMSILKSTQASSTEEGGESFEYPSLNILPVNNFVFTEGDLELAMSSSTVTVYPFNDLKIIVDNNRFVSEIKTLILRIQDPSDVSKHFSYSFNYDSTNNIFYAVIPNFGNKKIYSFSIISYGFDNKEVSISKGFFDVKSIEVSKAPLSLDFTKFIYISALILIVVLIILRYKNSPREI